VRVVGVTIARNAVELDLPIEAAVRSVLPLVDELVAVVGDSTDDTRARLAAIDRDRIHILDTRWVTEGRAGGSVLAEQTQLGLTEAERRGADWCFYIQADEVIARRDYDAIHGALSAADRRSDVEGVLFDYVHFFGDFSTVATSRNFYRREVRIVRAGIGVRSYRDAQGFRVGSGLRRVRAIPSGARVYHYGWVRSAESAARKTAVLEGLFSGRQARERPFEFSRLPGLRRYTGEHPEAIHDWIAARPLHWAWERQSTRWTRQNARYVFSAMIERLTGWRPGEFKNYRLLH